MLWLRATLAWVALMALESAHGAVRMLVLAPRLGEVRARQVAVFIGSLLILGVSALLARWLHAQTWRRLITVGCLWVVLTAGFEVMLGRLAFGYAWGRMIEDCDLRRGGLMGLGMVVLLLAPLIGARVRRVPPFER